MGWTAEGGTSSAALTHFTPALPHCPGEGEDQFSLAHTLRVDSSYPLHQVQLYSAVKVVEWGWFSHVLQPVKGSTSSPTLTPSGPALPCFPGKGWGQLSSVGQRQLCSVLDISKTQAVVQTRNVSMAFGGNMG